MITGKGWVPDETVTISPPDVSDFQAKSFTPAADPDGSWQATVTVGSSPPGRYAFTFTEDGCPSQSGTFKVTAPPKSSCSRVWFIGVRGSGEPASGDDGMGPEVHYMAKVMTAALAAKGLQLMPVFYTADSVVKDLTPSGKVLAQLAKGIALKDSDLIAEALATYKATSVAKYDASIDQGIQMTEQEVAYVLGLCPGAKIVLAGYSQGAIAVHDAENWLAVHKHGELAHVAGTLLLADPDRVPCTKAKEFGTSKTAKTASGGCPASGWLGTAKTAPPEGLRVSLKLVKARDVPLYASTANIANTDDIVADFSILHLINPGWLKDISVHTSYAGQAALRDAAKWVASQVLADK